MILCVFHDPPQHTMIHPNTFVCSIEQTSGLYKQHLFQSFVQSSVTCFSHDLNLGSLQGVPEFSEPGLHANEQRHARLGAQAQLKAVGAARFRGCAVGRVSLASGANKRVSQCQHPLRTMAAEACTPSTVCLSVHLSQYISLSGARPW